VTQGVGPEFKPQYQKKKKKKKELVWKICVMFSVLGRADFPKGFWGWISQLSEVSMEHIAEVLVTPGSCLVLQ
jgi:hypothetical protein